MVVQAAFNNPLRRFTLFGRLEVVSFPKSAGSCLMGLSCFSGFYLRFMIHFDPYQKSTRAKMCSGYFCITANLDGSYHDTRMFLKVLEGTFSRKCHDMKPT